MKAKPHRASSDPRFGPHFVDRLIEAIRAKSAPVCVGIDPVYERLPEAVRRMVDFADPRDAAAALDAIEAYVRELLEAVAPHVPAVKFQSACFERYLWMGVERMWGLMQRARELGLIVILDGKRNDIGISAEHYAAGCLADPDFYQTPDLKGPDALTVNAYLGDDALEPLMDVAMSQGKGLFALVRTTNPGSDALQTMKLADGRTVSDAVAEMVVRFGASSIGRAGYSALGAVVGGTKREDLAALRERMPHAFFLVPGYGAQGAGPDDVRACFKTDGYGALITASRSVIFAYERRDTSDWTGAVAEAASEMAEEVGGLL